MNKSSHEDDNDILQLSSAINHAINTIHGGPLVTAHDAAMCAAAIVSAFLQRCPEWLAMVAREEWAILGEDPRGQESFLQFAEVLSAKYPVLEATREQ